MISIELWRARIGLHCCRKCNNNPQSTDQPDSSISFISAFIACIIAILLVIGGIEINPGPITPAQDTHHKQELPAEIKYFIDALLSTTLSFEQLVQYLSVSYSSPSSIWGSICKKVYSRNKPDKRHSLEWRNNSYDVRTLVRDAFKPLVSPPSSEEQFHVSYSLSNLTIQRRASLVTSTILKEVSSSVAACFDSLSSFENLDLRKLEFDLVDDKLLIVWGIFCFRPGYV